MNAELEETKVVVCQACGTSNAAGAEKCASCGAPLPAAMIAPAANTVEAPAPATPAQPERGGCLTIWLGLGMILGVLAIPSAIGLLAATEYSPTIVYSALQGVCFGIAALAMWKWKKWGVYLYIITAVIGLALPLISRRVELGPVQMGIELSALGFVVTMLILYGLVKPRWQHFT